MAHTGYIITAQCSECPTLADIEQEPNGTYTADGYEPIEEDHGGLIFAVPHGRGDDDCQGKFIVNREALA